MNVITPSVELCNEQGLKKIELIGKVCTKKEHNIKEDSAEKFVKNRISEGHTAILLHEYCYFNISDIPFDIITDLVFVNRYIKISDCGNYMAINYRSILDLKCHNKRFINRLSTINNVEDVEELIEHIWSLSYELNIIFKTSESFILDYIDEDSNCITSYGSHFCLHKVSFKEILDNCPEIYNVTLKFVTDRGIANEIVRHSEISPMQESTRWCDYSGNGVSFVNPYEDENVIKSLNVANIKDCENIVFDSFATVESSYNEQRQNGVPAQIARNVLPIGLKTEIFMTGSLYDWFGEYINTTIGDITIKELKGFIPQRTAKSAHPQIKTLAEQAKTILIDNFSKYYDYNKK